MKKEIKTAYRVIYGTVQIPLYSAVLERKTRELGNRDKAIRETAKELIIDAKTCLFDFPGFETESIEAAKSVFGKISAGMKNGKPYYNGFNRIYIVTVACLEKEIEFEDGEIYSDTLEWAY